MKIIPLTEQSAAMLSINYKATFTYLDFAVAGLTKSVKVFPTAATFFPKGTVLMPFMYLYLPTYFTGGGVTATTVTVGTAGTANKYLTATNIFSTTGNWTKISTALPDPFNITTEDLQIAITTTTANTNALTAGVMELYFGLNDLNKLVNQI
jgi:hypothetical protein